MRIWRQEDWADAGNTAEVDAGRWMPKQSSAERDKPQSARAISSSDTEPGSQAQQISKEMKSAREKAVYYLQFSGKTEKELRKKLAEQEFSPASVDYAIEFVKMYRYLDDEDYTRRFVERNRNKKSRKQMVYELSQKGISKELMDLVLEDLEVDEEAQILAILEKREYSGEDASREEKQKISAYLARRGFSYEAITSALIQFARKTND